jgi:hypothetical protein
VRAANGLGLHQEAFISEETGLIPSAVPGARLSGLAAGILEYENWPTFTARKGERSNRPVGVKLIPKKVFVLEAGDNPRRRTFSSRGKHLHRCF